MQKIDEFRFETSHAHALIQRETHTLQTSIFFQIWTMINILSNRFLWFSLIHMYPSSWAAIPKAPKSKTLLAHDCNQWYIERKSLNQSNFRQIRRSIIDGFTTHHDAIFIENPANTIRFIIALKALLSCIEVTCWEIPKFKYFYHETIYWIFRVITMLIIHCSLITNQPTWTGFSLSLSFILPHIQECFSWNWTER